VCFHSHSQLCPAHVTPFQPLVCLHSLSQLCPVSRAPRPNFYQKKLVAWVKARSQPRLHVLWCALDLINKCVHSLVNNVVLFLDCQHGLHFSWEAHLLVAQRSPPPRAVFLHRPTPRAVLLRSTLTRRHR
jgi:hypothetical protein